MMRLTLAIASRCLFGADITDEASAVARAITEVMEDFLSIANLGFLFPDWIPFPSTTRFRRALKALDEIVYELIEQRRRSGKPSRDLLGMLLNAHDEDGTPMTDKQLRDEVMTLLLAGHETTANVLTWALYLLAQNPQIQEKVGREVTAEMVIKEARRLYPPAWAVGRKALEPFDLLGYRFPAWTNVFISQWIVHRDPRFFPEPERFDPERWVSQGNEQALPRFAYFPFGAGPRVCEIPIQSDGGDPRRIVAFDYAPAKVWDAVAGGTTLHLGWGMPVVERPLMRAKQFSFDVVVERSGPPRDTGPTRNEVTRPYNALLADLTVARARNPIPRDSTNIGE